MADARTPTSSKRKTTSRSSNGSQKSRSGSAQRSRSGSARASTPAPQSTPAQPSRNGSTNTVVITGLATAAAGVVGGVILGKRLNERPRHILGVRVPGSGAGMSDLVAGKQIADLTDEVRAAREKAEDIGRAIS